MLAFLTSPTSNILERTATTPMCLLASTNIIRELYRTFCYRTRERELTWTSKFAFSKTRREEHLFLLRRESTPCR